MRSCIRKGNRLGIVKKGLAFLEAAKLSYPAIRTTDVRYDQVGEYAHRLADFMRRKEAIVHRMVDLSSERKEYFI
ncbi:MAG: hypothetical protein IMW92_01445 [Bacillales bacterium]|nr:hypothetical protein [Bacillales bacterium]